jgi:bifunctional UDP-N-acetylglucosamine pyrophosphorylase/glucosamine-1-phosphate N-acetyltransferase
MIKKKLLILKHKKNGVLFLDATDVAVDNEVKLGKGVVIGSGVKLFGKTEIGQNSEITGDSVLENAKIGSNVKIKSSYISDSQVGDKTSVGPFAHLRKNSVIGAGCRVGNFVEIKNSTLGNNTKCAHLAYIGDAEIGNEVNIGCGVVFANFDGKVKNRTIVGNRVFIGCNCNLVAPLKIDNDCFIAAGTTVTQDLPPDSFCIGRVRQEVKERKKE